MILPEDCVKLIDSFAPQHKFKYLILPFECGTIKLCSNCLDVLELTKNEMSFTLFEIIDSGIIDCNVAPNLEIRKFWKKITKRGPKFSNENEIKHLLTNHFTNYNFCDLTTFSLDECDAPISMPTRWPHL